ncbi:MAG TPA: hypothetical protein VLI90_05050 [Tepidisphaeraceae bacterium]|nr:hypothetical protein [Tepidisphaeraceae bacterium]
MNRRRCRTAALAGAMFPLTFVGSTRAAAPAWSGYANDPFHAANAPAASDPLSSIRWQTPVDLSPQFSGNDLLIHYGSPTITAANTLLVPVKTGASGGFEINAINGATGSSKWSVTSDYVLPPHNWVPSYSPALTPNNRMYYAGAGGTIYWRDTLDGAAPSAAHQLAFFGDANYAANPSAYNSNVFINTPITSDASGNIYFGFRVTGSTPLGAGLSSGIARIGADGSETFTSAAAAAGGDAVINNDLMNCAPALSRDGSKLYITLTGGGVGDLVSLNSSTLAPQAHVRLKDPASGADAEVTDDGSASPTVGPDGHVYMGVLENPFPSNHDRGWMLHYTGDLSAQKTTGAFGWDDTASIVPASMVPGYAGPSSYLLMTKYNNYAGLGGDGVNKLAILDPNATETDPVTGATVMKEVLSIAGVTPDGEFPSKPGAVREWCINSAVVDPSTDSILANSEDGKLYRWDLGTNTFMQVITLTPGVGEAYTPTLVGPDGAVYAINNATLFSVVPEPTSGAMVIASVTLVLARRRRHV